MNINRQRRRSIFHRRRSPHFDAVIPAVLPGHYLYGTAAHVSLSYCIRQRNPSLLPARAMRSLQLGAPGIDLPITGRPFAG